MGEATFRDDAVTIYIEEQTTKTIEKTTKANTNTAYVKFLTQTGHARLSYMVLRSVRMRWSEHWTFNVTFI